MKRIAQVLVLMVCAGSVVAQSANDAPLKLRVATYNVRYFNQGVAGGLEVRGEAVYGKVGKQKNGGYTQNIEIMNVSAPRTGLNDLGHLPVIADLTITW